MSDHHAEPESEAKTEAGLQSETEINARLLLAAQSARQRAHAPYSAFQVGAALLLTDGHVLTGVNVENSSFGLTVCAERHAVAAAIAAGYRRGDFRRILIVAHADAGASVSPCGACRQVLSEFAGADFPVLSHNLADGQRTQWRLGDLLIDAFAGERLPATSAGDTAAG